MGRGDALASGAKKQTFYPAVSTIPAANVAETETHDPLPSHVDNLAEFTKKPKVCYRGQARANMVLVQTIEKESNSRIIIPDASRSKSDVGIVKSVGHGIQDLVVGDTVLYDRFAAVGQSVNLIDESGEDREYLLLANHDILIVLTPVTSE
jgi:co-chaperonin GroES (HSP10)